MKYELICLLDSVHPLPDGENMFLGPLLLQYVGAFLCLTVTNRVLEHKPSVFDCWVFVKIWSGLLCCHTLLALRLNHRNCSEWRQTYSPPPPPPPPLDYILNWEVSTEDSSLVEPPWLIPGYYLSWLTSAPAQRVRTCWLTDYWSSRFVVVEALGWIQTLCQTSARSEKHPDPRITCLHFTSAASGTRRVHTHDCISDLIDSSTDTGNAERRESDMSRCDLCFLYYTASRMQNKIWNLFCILTRGS